MQSNRFISINPNINTKYRDITVLTRISSYIKMSGVNIIMSNYVTPVLIISLKSVKYQILYTK